MERNLQILDDQACFRSLGPRAVGFDIEQLSSELGPQRNVGDETRKKFTQKDFRGGGLIANVSRVCHGSFKQKKATIIVIQLIFHAPKSAHQFRHLEVVASFEPLLSGSNSSNADSGPVVRNLSPCKMSGTPDTGGRRWLYKVEQYSLTRTMLLDPSPMPENSEKGTAVASSFLTVTGKPWSDSRKRDMHKACWIVKDNGQPLIGIPDEMYVAVAVESEYSFKATLKVVLDIPLHRKLLALPWSEDDPVLFPLREPGPFIGERLRTTQFEMMTDIDWAYLISGYEDMHAASDQASHLSASGPAMPSSRSIRIRGIPVEYEFDNVSELFISIFGLKREEYDIEVRSLVLDVELLDQKVATVESPFLEASFLKGVKRQEIAFSGHAHGRSPSANNRHIIIDTHFHNFTPLGLPNQRSQYAFDIIALSGLGGHSFGSFKERNGNHMWLRDDLPRDFPHAQILTYGYDVRLEDSRSFPEFEALASTLRTALKIVRRSSSLEGGPNDKPIIFIAHSLGGIVLKQVLIQMADGDELDKTLSRAVRGILFFGVPSQGMDISSLLPMVDGNVNEPFLHSLRRDSDILRSQHREFCVKFPYDTCKMVSFYETEYSPTARKGPSGWKMDGEPALLVGPSSATLGSRAWEVGPNYSHPIKRDHSTMVKFHPGDQVYSVVRHVLEDLSQGTRPL